MTRALPRTNFNRSRLVRALSSMGVVDFAESNQPLAERLGQWLGVAEAIALHAALGGGAAADRRGAPAAGADGLHGELEGLRATLEAQARQQLSALSAGGEDFAAYRRCYLAQQRGMATGIEALRGRAREALARHSPRLRQLAELDAVLAQALGGRERELLAVVPQLLEKRFETLRQARQPDGWQTRFGAELLEVLLAELELRLQPLAGLLGMYDKEVEGN